MCEGEIPPLDEHHNNEAQLGLRLGRGRATELQLVGICISERPHIPSTDDFDFVTARRHSYCAFNSIAVRWLAGPFETVPAQAVQ